jgi:predicted CopG family antitoxin
MTKIISITDEAYIRLSNLKKGKESFTDVVLKLTEKEKKRSLLDFAGAWKGEKEEMTRIFDEIKKERENIKTRDIEL